MTLPLPVRRKRFFEPLCVFIFGMVADLLRVACVRVAYVVRGPAGSGSPPGSPDRRSLGGGGLGGLGGLLGLLGGLLAGQLGLRRDLGGRGGPGAALLGAGLGLLLRRSDHHDHVATVLLRRRLDVAELGDVVGETLEQAAAELGTALLATAEHDRHLDLVTGLEEPPDVALLSAVVVRVDLRAELDLLD